MTRLPASVDIAIVGAGAAGLTAGIWAGRSGPGRSIALIDGARTLGAKILVAGGGRCNVTHHEVDPRAYAGGSYHGIKKVLDRFDVPQTVAFFRELGVALKREDTGKLFPTSDSARSVLDALLRGVDQAGARIYHPNRVEAIERQADGFVLAGPWGQLAAGKVVLATGGRSLPKSGSDGHGQALAVALGHSLTERIFPALVPLTLPPEHFIRSLSGITIGATLTLYSASGKRLASFTNSTLCTHVGLSGPSVLDMSRYYIAASLEKSGARLAINWLPDETSDSFDQALQALGASTPLRLLRERLPERLTRALCDYAGVEAGAPGHQLTRPQRRALAAAVTDLPLPISGNRGYNFAEVTAGGVPLPEINLNTMESRRCPGLYLCGEICDVDGRIGGFNFQWAWASGYVAGVAVGQAEG